MVLLLTKRIRPVEASPRPSPKEGEMFLRTQREPASPQMAGSNQRLTADVVVFFPTLLLNKHENKR